MTEDRRSTSRILDRIKAAQCARGLGRICSALVAAVLIASVAGASEGANEGVSEDLGDRFGVFLDAGPHVIVQRAKGRVATNFGVDHDKSNILANMTFRLGGGIKGPELTAIWGAPRPVVWAAALVPLNGSGTIGAEFVEGVVPSSQRIDSSKFTVEYQTGGLVALGLEFQVPVFDSAISITPAIESLTLPSRYTGRVKTVFSQQNVPSHFFQHNTDIVQSFVGPAVRLGTSVVVVRGFTINFYLDASLLLDVAGTHRAQTVRNPSNGDRAKFTWETGSGLIQVGSGLQIRWP